MESCTSPNGQPLSSNQEAVHMNLVHKAANRWYVLLYSGFQDFNMLYQYWLTYIPETAQCRFIYTHDVPT